MFLIALVRQIPAVVYRAQIKTPLIKAIDLSVVFGPGGPLRHPSVA